MTNYAYNPEVQCQGKFKHVSYSAAESTFGHRHHHGLKAYKCPYCGFWHVAGVETTRTYRKAKNEQRIG